MRSGFEIAEYGVASRDDRTRIVVGEFHQVAVLRDQVVRVAVDRAEEEHFVVGISGTDGCLGRDQLNALEGTPDVGDESSRPVWRMAALQ